MMFGFAVFSLQHRGLCLNGLILCLIELTFGKFFMSIQKYRERISAEPVKFLFWLFGQARQQAEIFPNFELFFLIFPIFPNFDFFSFFSIRL